MKSKIEEAQSTCDGLHRLIRRLQGAADDLDKGGESAHELLALLASTNVCINNLSKQLRALDHAPAEGSNVSVMKPSNDKISDATDQPTAVENIPEKIRAVAGR